MTWLRDTVRKVRPKHVIYVLLVSVVFLSGFAVATPNMPTKRNLLTAVVLVSAALVFVVTWYFEERIAAAERVAERARGEAEAVRVENEVLRRQAAGFARAYEADRNVDAQLQDARLQLLIAESGRSA